LERANGVTKHQCAAAKCCEWLPVIWIGSISAGGDHGGGVRRGIAAPIRVGTLREIPELIGFVMVTEFEDGGTGHVANARRRLDIGGRIGRVVAELSHQGVVDRLGASREHIREGAIGGVADGTFLVGRSAFGKRAAERTAQLSAGGFVVISGPRIVDAGVDNGQDSRCHWCPHPRVAHALQNCSIPALHQARVLLIS